MTFCRGVATCTEIIFQFTSIRFRDRDIQMSSDTEKLKICTPLITITQVRDLGVSHVCISSLENVGSCFIEIPLGLCACPWQSVTCA